MDKESWVINRQSREEYIHPSEYETAEERRDRLQTEKRQALILDQAQQENKKKEEKKTLEMEKEIDRLKAEEPLPRVRMIPGIETGKIDITGVAVRVDNKRESEAVQKLFFSLGYGWVHDGKNYIDCDYEITWIYIRNDVMFLNGEPVTDKRNITALQFLLEFKEHPFIEQVGEPEADTLDYSRLKPGMMVKIKSWDRLVKEYGPLDEEGRIQINGMMMCLNVDDRILGKICEIKEIELGPKVFCVKHNYHHIITLECIESIISEPEPPDDYDLYHGNWKLTNVGMPDSCYFYRKPRLVKALWLGQDEGEFEIDTFDMLLYCDSVGVIINSDKYILHTGGPDRGIAIQAHWQWASRAEQEKYKCKYYIFESARDLYLWMAEGKV
jgi:hypothetical protein